MNVAGQDPVLLVAPTLLVPAVGTAALAVLGCGLAVVSGMQTGAPKCPNAGCRLSALPLWHYTAVQALQKKIRYLATIRNKVGGASTVGAPQLQLAFMRALAAATSSQHAPWMLCHSRSSMHALPVPACCPPRPCRSWCTSATSTKSR